MDNLKDKIKVALRITEDVFDSEIDTLVTAALLDLEESNIDTQKRDELLDVAVIFYVKAMFGYDNTDSEKQLRAYERTKTKMALASRWQDARQ